MSNELNDLLKNQIDYYRSRASEYDEWFLRVGRYNHGNESNEKWFNEVKELVAVLNKFKPKGNVLELACGTGWWTEQLADYADTITAIDASPEVIEINKKRLEKYKNKVTYQQHDLFTWIPDKKYDVIFFSFWLSHIPPSQFNQFWDKVRLALKPDGKVFFIDSLAEPTATASNQTARNNEGFTNLRKLNDGREFNIIKIFYEPNSLKARLSTLGLNANINSTAKYFLYGEVSNIES